MTRITSTSVEGPNHPLTFRELTNTDRIGMCQALLPNKMQCTKPGKFLASNNLQYCGSHILQLNAGLIDAPLNPIPAGTPNEGEKINEQPANSSGDSTPTPTSNT